VFISGGYFTRNRELFEGFLSSVNFYSFTGTSASTAKTIGSVEVLLNFDAKNAFGTDIGHTVRCIFPPQQPREIEISLRQ
jgi:hypothetical protein